LIGNASPWENLKFDLAGIEEVKRKFFGTLYNTYNFFALYTNIDGFEYSARIPASDRSELDRWILSCLNTLIKKVDFEIADFEPTRAIRLIENFLNEQLSNWYVRLISPPFLERRIERRQKSRLSNFIRMPRNNRSIDESFCTFLF